VEEWKKEILEEDELLFNLHDSLPKELIFQRELLVARL
jgi:phosphoenolpyruvate carboxykinase (GTP)